jgi:hypothetical protein
MLVAGVASAAEFCWGDLDNDRDADGSDVARMIADLGRTDCETNPPCRGDIYPNEPPDRMPDDAVDGADVMALAVDFGRADCPFQAPLNLFNIGNSIGEAIAADGTIGSSNHDTVWSTGHEQHDDVYTLNERFDDMDPSGFFENKSTRDPIFNHAIEGDEMEDFADQANAMILAAGETPSGKVGMVTVFLGNNDVCTDAVGTMTDLGLFETQYRAGLTALADSDITKNAYIHVSGIPAIYWLWYSKRSRFWCWAIAWPFVPCKELLEEPREKDCTSDEDDPDTIDYDNDGPVCIRRKEFHQAIRDDYNRIIRDVLMEYKADGRLPNAYYIDIFDIQFESEHVNNGDCFHPSEIGHATLAQEHWCRSPWNTDDSLCTTPP